MQAERANWQRSWRRAACAGMGEAPRQHGGRRRERSATAAARPRRLHGRRLLEQLPAAPLGGPRRARHQGHGRGRRRHLHRRRRQPQHRAAGDRHRHAHLAGRQRPHRPGPGHRRSCRRRLKAPAAGIPVIAYDRLIEDPSILYITFDNTASARRGAAVLQAGPDGQLRASSRATRAMPTPTSCRVAHGRRHPGCRQRGRSAPATPTARTCVTDGTFTDAGRPRTPRPNMEASSTANPEQDRRGPVRERRHGPWRHRRPDGPGHRLSRRCPARTATRPPQQRCAGQADVDVWKDAAELGKAAGAAALAAVRGGDMPPSPSDGLLDPASLPPPASRPCPSRRPAATPSPRSSCSPLRSPRTTCRWSSTAEITKAELCKGVDASARPPARNPHFNPDQRMRPRVRRGRFSPFSEST